MVVEKNSEKSRLSGMEVGILSKAKQINKNPEEYLSEVCEQIDKLDKHSKSDKIISKDEIKCLVESLTRFTFLPIIQIDPGIPLVRSVRVQGNIEDFNNLSRLSYRPIEEEKEVGLGRMNSEGQSMFYASLNNDENSFGTVLSEVRAQKGEEFKILECLTRNLGEKKYLNLVSIGANDYFRRGVPHPFHLHERHYELYEFQTIYTHPTGMKALNLCDAYLNDVLKREAPKDKMKAKRLYEVTSAIANECLKMDQVDGIAFPSTKFEDFPNVVLKPASVDKKIDFYRAISICAEDVYGYGVYQTIMIDIGSINGSKITWNAPEEVMSLAKSLDDVILEFYEKPAEYTLFLQFMKSRKEEPGVEFDNYSYTWNVGVSLSTYHSFRSICLEAERNNIDWTHFFAEVSEKANSTEMVNAFSRKVWDQSHKREIDIPFYGKNGRRLMIN